MQTIPLDQIKAFLISSIFNRNKYRVDRDLPSIFNVIFNYTTAFQPQLEQHTLADIKPEFASSDYLYERGMVPHFQRDNQKWSDLMKASFIENLLRGCRSDVMLYTTKDRYAEHGYASLQILDGLQRLSAMCDFIGGKISAFGYSSNELTQAKVLSMSTIFGICIYIFKNDIEAAIHYIQMNKNITHSEGDIEKAAKFVECNLARECLSVDFLSGSETLTKEKFVDQTYSTHGRDVELEEQPITAGEHKLLVIKRTKIGGIDFSIILGAYIFEYPNASWLASKPIEEFTLS